MAYQIPTLPFEQPLQSEAVLLKLVQTHRALAEMKGLSNSIPNPEVLNSTLALQEAKASSEIENLVTTHDDLFRAQVDSAAFRTREAKEVFRYAESLQVGFEKMQQTGLLTMKLLEEVQIQLVGNNAGFRKQGGTVLRNDRTGEVVYVPPQSRDEILDHLSNLERFINDASLCDWDPLVKLAVMHHQFESIHPFYDGNGRSGRVLNVLFLVHEKLIDVPVLYHSRFINARKGEYYRLLQLVRDTGEWEEWILFMLSAIELTSLQTIGVIHGMRTQMHSMKGFLREKTKFYSQDLLNSLFKHPYTKIDFTAKELRVSGVTARSYLEQLVELGILTKVRIGKPNYYVNHRLVELITRGNTLS